MVDVLPTIAGLFLSTHHLVEVKANIELVSDKAACWLSPIQVAMSARIPVLVKVTCSLRIRIIYLRRRYVTNMSPTFPTKSMCVDSFIDVQFQMDHAIQLF